MKKVRNIDKVFNAESVGYIKRKEDSLLSSGSKYFPVTKKSLGLLQQAEYCYDSLSNFRKNRRRCVKYYNGDQWSDMVVVDGVPMSESKYISMQGKPALKQNIIKPQIKNIIGQFRSNPYKSTIVARNRDDQMASEMMSVALESAYAMNDGKERDARELEEFLNSGYACYLTSYSFDNERQRAIPKFRAVDAERLILDPNSVDVCGEDISFIGDFIDISLEEVIQLFATQDNIHAKAEELKKIYSSISDSFSLGKEQKSKPNNENLSVRINADNSLCRVIRLCRLEQKELLYCHDYVDGTEELRDLVDEKLIQAENDERIRLGIENGVLVPPIEYERRFMRIWHYYHLSPYGNILFECETPYEHKNHPYVVMFYPMIDGMAMGLTNDLIDQQKMINRMVILFDFIISASAKGVLLVPEDCIPEDMDISDIAESWTKYNGVIKIKAKPGVPLPQQVAANNINIGLSEFINMQMEFAKEISGVHGAIKGENAASGTAASLYQQQAMNAQLNVLDYLESFIHFLQKRDYKIGQLIQQYYTEPQYIALAGKTYSEDAKHWNPDRIRNIDFDYTVTRSNDTPTFRMVQDSVLKDLLLNNFISVEVFLEHSSYPFSDKLLQSVRAARQQLEAQQAQQQQAMAMQQQGGGMQMQQGGADVEPNAPVGDQRNDLLINQFLQR